MEPRSMEAPSTNEERFLSLENLNRLPRSLVVKKLLSWKQSDEDEKWTEKAVKMLVIKLKDTKSSIKELGRALSCPGAPSTCVTIPRNRNGHLQIFRRKYPPHVIYCRIWRWPDVQNHHELTSLPECQFAFYKKLNQICVNPCHYNRVDAIPMLLPINNDFVTGHALLPFQRLREPTTLQTDNYTENECTGLDFDAARLTSSILQPQNSNLDELQPQPLSNLIEELSIFINSNNLLPELNNLINDYKLPELQPPPQPINYEEQHYWASITYYEANSRVGETFDCKNKSIIVDGLTDPDKNGSRFCLGQLRNIYRNPTIAKVRKNIGKGIRVRYVNEEVHVECLSNASIFVQSKISNHVETIYPTTVRQIYPGTSLKVFDYLKFSKLLAECVKCNFDSVYQLTEMCRIRIAFVTDWGSHCKRKDIASSWIEINFHMPLKWIDQALIKMKGPTDQISSTDS